MRTFALATLLASSFAAAPAFAQCPYTATASWDGCASAPVANANAIQHPYFFAGYAGQMGQHYTGPTFSGSIANGVLTITGASGTVVGLNDTIVGFGGTAVPAGVFISSFGTGTGGNGTYNLANASGVTASGAMNSLRRPPWNVAGVDYPVGVNAGITLVDPATLPACAGSPWPSPCNGLSAYHQHLVVVANGNNPVINGYDFTRGGGWELYVTSPYVTGVVTITNNKFGGGTNFRAGGDLHSVLTNAFGVDLSAVNVAQVVAEYNLIDLGANKPPYRGTQTSDVIGVGVSGTHETTPPIFRYNAYLNANGRVNFGFGADVRYNYFEGVNYNSGIHGEFTTFGQFESCMYVGDTGPRTEAQNQTFPPMDITLEYNTALQPNDYAAGTTTLFYLSSGLYGGNWRNIKTDYNVLVNNANAVSVSANTGFEIAWSNPANFQLGSPANIAIFADAKRFATLGAQVSGISGPAGYGGGTWNYTGSVPVGAGGRAYIGTQAGSWTNIGNGGYPTDWAAAVWDCSNNYVDNSGLGYWNANTTCVAYAGGTPTQNDNTAMPR